MGMSPGPVRLGLRKGFYRRLSMLALRVAITSYQVQRYVETGSTTQTASLPARP